MFRSLCLFFAFSSFAFAQVKLVTSTTDLAWAAKEIGKELVSVRSLLNGSENPHYVDTVPSFIQQVSDAQVVCLVGLDLEIGWMPKVLSRSGNAQVQPGGKGYCETGNSVDVLEKASGPVDRSMGDVHPSGNPHYWLSPTALGQGSVAIKDALIRVDPAHTAQYEKNYQEFVKALGDYQKKKAQAIAKLLGTHAGPAVMEYHKEFTYYFKAFGLSSFGSIEEKPGVPPSAGRLAEIGTSAKSAKVKVAMAGLYAPEKTLAKFSEISEIPVLRLPTSVQKSGKAADYYGLQDTLFDALTGALAGKKG